MRYNAILTALLSKSERFLYRYYILCALFCQAIDSAWLGKYNEGMADSILQPIENADAGASCPTLNTKLVNAFGLLQEKWALFIVYALLRGPVGFNEMSRNAGRINSTTLAQRLVLLEQAGLIRKTVHSTMPPRTSYELTEAGRGLQPVIEAIAAWSERYMPDHMAGCAEG